MIPRRTTLILVCSALFLWQPLRGADTQTATDPLAELKALRQQLSEQQRTIDELRTQLGAQSEKLDRLISAVAAPKPTANSEVIVTPAIQARTEKQSEPAPLTLQLGKVHFKPGGFLDLGFVARSTNVGSGVPTSFGSIPFGDTVQGQLSDVRFSAQNSRISMAAETSFADVDLKAYVEADFLGTAPANLAVTSNGGTFRMRQYWARMGTSKWAVVGGQAWSLLTPNRVGLGAEPSSVFTTVNEDPNYMVGLVWGRDPQVRVILTPGNGFSLGFSLEAAEQYSAGVVALPAALASTYGTQINNGGGNLAAPTVMPDIIAKLAWDGTLRGRQIHMEGAGLARAFRVYDPLNTQHHTTPSYGGSLNGSVEVVHDFRLLLNSFISNGGGRYIFGQGPDLIARPDGSLQQVQSDAGLGGFEYTRRPKVNPNGLSSVFFGYFGGTYFQRETTTDTDGTPIGFGYVGSSSNANRIIQQVSFGLNQTIWSNPLYGRVRVLTQASYLTRSPWWMAPERPRNASSKMAFVGLRYELP